MKAHGIVHVIQSHRHLRPRSVRSGLVNKGNYPRPNFVSKIKTGLSSRVIDQLAKRDEHIPQSYSKKEHGEGANEAVLIARYQLLK